MASWKKIYDDLEVNLRHEKTGIATCNKKLGPGISRKDFETLIRENIRMKKELDHIVDAYSGGQNVLKNQEFYELVTTLQKNLAEHDQHIREFEKTLASERDALATRVNELTKLVMKNERSVKAEQVFSENILKEDLPDGHVRNNAPVPNDQNVAPQSAVRSKDSDKQVAMIENKEKITSEYSTKIQEMGEEIEKLSKQNADLSSELEKANHVINNNEAELKETTKKYSDEQKKCVVFFKRVLKSCEENFQQEKELKKNLEKELTTAQQEIERLKRESQSHMTTIRHFETEIERLNKLLNDDKKCGQNEVSVRDGHVDKKCMSPQQESDPMVGKEYSHVEKAKSRSENEQKAKSSSDNKSYCEVNCHYNKCSIVVNVNGPNAQVNFRD